MICASWEGNSLKNFLQMFPCFSSRKISGYYHLVLNPSDESFVNYEYNFKESIETIFKEKNNEEVFGINIFGETEEQNCFATKFSKFGKIAVAANGSFYDIQKINDEIFQKRKVLFTNFVSELILNIIVEGQDLLTGIKGVPKHLGGKYNFCVLGNWGIYIYCCYSSKLIITSRKDGGVIAGTKFEQINDYDIMNVANGIIHLQNGSSRAVP